jgi:hypothetical protein
MVSFIREDQRENQEEDGSRSSRGTRHSSMECEDGGDEQKTEKNGGLVWWRSGSRRGCSAIDGVDGWMDGYRKLKYFVVLRCFVG